MDILKLLAVIRDVSLTLASIAGGLWAFYKFRKMRMSESKLEMELIPAVYHNVKSKVVNVTIRLRNIGNVAIIAKEPECLLETKVITDELKDSTVYWDENGLPSLFPQPIEFLKDFGPWDAKNPYIIEPGITETVQIVFSTNYCGIVLLQARFVDKDNYKYMTKAIVDLRVATSHSGG